MAQTTAVATAPDAHLAPRWRVASDDFGFLGGVARVCPNADPGHRVNVDVEPGYEIDEAGLYSCCPAPAVMLGDHMLARGIVDVLNAASELADNPDAIKANGSAVKAAVDKLAATMAGIDADHADLKAALSGLDGGKP